MTDQQELPQIIETKRLIALDRDTGQNQALPYIESAITAAQGQDEIEHRLRSMRAMMLVHLGRYEETIVECKAIAEQYGDDHMVLTPLRRAYLAVGENTKAAIIEAKLKKNKKENDNRPRFSGSVPDFTDNSYLQLVQNNPAVLIDDAKLLIDADQRNGQSQTLTYLEGAIKIAEGNDEIVRRLRSIKAMTLTHAGRNEEAITECFKVAPNGDDPMIWRPLHKAYIATGRSQEAAALVVQMREHKRKQKGAPQVMRQAMDALEEITAQSDTAVSFPSVTITGGNADNKIISKEAPGKIDFTHQFHNLDEWFIFNDTLRPLAWLVEQKEVTSRVHAYTPFFTSQELSSPVSMQAALENWYDRSKLRIGQGLTIGLPYSEAMSLLQEDFHKHKDRIPEYIQQYQEQAAIWLEKAKPVQEDIHPLFVRAFHDDWLLPLPFAVLLDYFGKPLILASEIGSRITPSYILLGSENNESVKKDGQDLFADLSQVIVRIVGKQLTELSSTAPGFDKLAGTILPDHETRRITNYKVIKERGGHPSDIFYGLGSLHSLKSSGGLSNIVLQNAFPETMKTYAALVNLAAQAAIELRPDLNNALEMSRAMIVHGDRTNSFPEVIQSYENLPVTRISELPIVYQASDTYGTPAQKNINAMLEGYAGILPSIRQNYNRYPSAFLLTGSDKPEYSKALQLLGGGTTLLVGADYFDVQQLYRKAFDVSYKDDRPLQVGNLDEAGIYAAIGRGLIKAEYHALAVASGSNPKPAITGRLEQELSRYIPKHYIDSDIKKVFVATIIGEICEAAENRKLSNRFRECLSYNDTLSQNAYLWSRQSSSEDEPALPSGSQSFTINRTPGVLTPPQTKLFETLNALMHEMQVTPAEMDAAFRFETFKMINWLHVEEAEFVEKSRKIKFKIQSPEVINVRPIDGYEVEKQNPLALERVLTKTLQGQNPPYTEGIISAFAPYFMDLPPYASTAQRKDYDEMLMKITKEAFGGDLFAYNNVLQSYASGKKLLDVIREFDFETSQPHSRGPGGFADKRLTRLELENGIVQEQIVYHQRPSYDKIFQQALLGAIDEFSRFKYAESPEPDSVQRLRSELKVLISSDGKASVHDTNARGAFLSNDAIYLIERELKRLEEFEKAYEAGRAADAASVAALKQEYERHLAEEAEKNRKLEEERRRIEETTPAAVALDGKAIKRIIHEAGLGTHRNNSRERNDDIERLEWLSKQLQTLGSLECMNAKFRPHAELATVLFSDEIMRPLEFVHIIPMNGNANKFPAVTSETRERLAHALQQVFAIDRSDESIRADDLNRNENLKQRILEFPGLIIAALGGEKVLRVLRDKYTIPLHSDIPPYAERNTVKRVALTLEREEKAKEILVAKGIMQPIVESTTSPLTQSTEQKEIVEQPKQTAETAQTEQGPQVAKEFTSIIAAENGNSHAKATEAKINPVTFRTLTEDEIFERDLKRLEAFEETQPRLLANAQMYLMQAQNRGFDRFECRIDLNRPDFPIRLQFSREEEVEGEKKIRRADFVLDKYSQAYTDRGIPLTMEDAVDLKISVQSMILNTVGIVPARDIYASGSPTVGLDTQMPLPVLDYSTIQRSGGMYTLICEAQDPYTRKLIYPSIPLGLAARHENEAAEQLELQERTQFVIDYLHKVGSQRTPEGFRTYVVKRDVLVKLQSWLEDQNKEWATAERTPLEGFGTSTLVYVSPQGNQKITLGPLSLSMDIGGDNQSLHCSLPLYVGDKNKPSMGELVRTRSLNLRTRNLQLATARALESLRGVRSMSGEQVVEGFLPHLQRHMRSTGDEWRVENKGENLEEVFIGNQPLQHFLDDMMRYERDIGVVLDKREIDTNGDVKITIQAIRSLTADYGKKAQFTSEHVHESEDDVRKPVAFTLTIPRDKAAGIEKFVDAVHEHIRWHADEAYSSIALGANGEQDTRKSPLEYRTAQIRQRVFRAVEKLYQEHFHQKLPKTWHKPVVNAAVTSDFAKNAKAYRQYHKPSFESEDRHVRFVHRSHNPWNHALG